MNENGRNSSFMVIDLLFFTILAALSEFMSNMLLRTWQSSFYFSFSIALCLIAMIRWGAVGSVVGILGGIPGILFSDMSFFSGVLFYGFANALIGLPMLLYGERDRNHISRHYGHLLLYILLCHSCVSLGKGMVIFLLTGETTGVIDHFGATCFILVINVILCSILKTRDGLICDMRYYFAEEDGEGNPLLCKEGGRR